MKRALWTPADERKESSRMHSFLQFSEQQTGKTFRDYPALYEWSVAEPETFWDKLWDLSLIHI